MARSTKTTKRAPLPHDDLLNEIDRKDKRIAELEKQLADQHKKFIANHQPGIGDIYEKIETEQRFLLLQRNHDDITDGHCLVALDEHDSESSYHPFQISHVTDEYNGIKNVFEDNHEKFTDFRFVGSFNDVYKAQP